MDDDDVTKQSLMPEPDLGLNKDSIDADVKKKVAVDDPYELEHKNSYGDEIDLNGYEWDERTLAFYPVGTKPAEDDAVEKTYKERIDSMDDVVKDYGDILKRYDAPESKEDRAKRERKERSKKIIAAVADGLRALSNIYFTGKGAISTYNANDSLLKGVMAGIDRARADRKENDEGYYKAYDKLFGLKGQKGKLEAELAKYKVERADKDAEAQRAKDLNDARIRQYDAQASYYGGRERVADAQANKYNVDAETLPELRESQIRKNNAQATKALMGKATAATGGGKKGAVALRGKHADGSSYELSMADVRAMYEDISQEARDLHLRYDRFDNQLVPNDNDKIGAVAYYLKTKGCTANMTVGESKASTTKGTKRGGTTTTNRPKLSITD